MTAVEWLINELHKKQNDEGSKLSYNHMFDKAKEMERQQKEVTDIEIEKAAKEYDYQSTRYGAKGIFLDAIKWYREELKIKENK